VEEHPRLTLIGEVDLSFGKKGNMSSPWKLSETELPQAAVAVPA
jgi:hypothetical protein